MTRAIPEIILTLLLASMVTLAFNFQPFKPEAKIWTADDDKASDPRDESSEHSDLNTVNGLEHASANAAPNSTSLFGFYYPWYGTPNVSGYWFHWNEGDHNPENFSDGRKDIGAKHYPLLDVYDSNNENLIEEHIEIAKMANIDGFVVSWWGIGSFEDNALFHIKNVAEQNNFKFTIYYETTLGLNNTLNDILYLLDNYGSSSSWYKIDNRPVIYVYGRALRQLSPKMWKIGGSEAHWSLFEDIRDSPRDGIFVIHPEEDGVGYVESYDIFLNPNESYNLEIGISNMRDDCPPHSDVGFRIKIRNETNVWETLDDLVVNFNEGWLDLSYNISSYAGQTVSVRVESYAGGVMEWCSEWAAVDYSCIVNSKGEIINEGPYFDNGWKTVVNNLKKRGYNPFFIMDFGGYEWNVQDFAEYFLNFTDGIHTYNPVALSMANISDIYHKASNAAHAKNKIFVATVMPGYDDTEVRSPGYTIDRQNGSYYESFWSTANSSSPDHYIITSFNEWHEGTEIEPSLEYGYHYINLTKMMSITWTPDTTPPITIDDYDGLWHTTDFTITLTATDDLSGVAKTDYRINVNSVQNISAHGHPFITIGSANNTLKYWSIDNAGNEENHKFLTGIKLDKTAPTGSIRIDNDAAYTNSTSVTLTITATDTISGVFQVRFSNDGVWDTEPWETFLTTKEWTLTADDGTKSVYHQIKDNAGLISETYSDTIILDTTAQLDTDDDGTRAHAEAFPLWVIGTAAVLIGIPVVATFLWRRKKRTRDSLSYIWDTHFVPTSLSFGT